MAVAWREAWSLVARRAAPYVLGFLLAVQLLVPALVPSGLVYGERLGYEYFRTNHADLHLAIHVIRAEVRRDRLQDYVFILGDSVAYSARTLPEDSPGPYLEALAREKGRPIRVFNLAQPSMQTGDIYTVVLMLKEHGLSTAHLVCNLLYGGFVARDPFPPAVFWLEDDLRRLDPATYQRVLPSLEPARLDPLSKPPATLDARFDRFVSRRVYPLITPLAYRDFIWAALARRLTGTDPKAEQIDPRPWTQKGHLPTILREDQYQRQFADRAFVLDETNLQVFFIDRIIAAASQGAGSTGAGAATADGGAGAAGGGQVLFFLSPVNQTLMRDNVAKPGYRENVARLDGFFASRPALYLTLESRIPDPLFADHLHLTPEGNRALAGLLWDALEKGGGH